MENLARQHKVLNMMLTMHSILRDRYLFYAAVSDITLLIASVVLNSLVFIDSGFIERMVNMNSDTQRMIAGLTAIIIFAISVLSLQVRWKEKAEKHQMAHNQLFKLLQESRRICNLPPEKLSEEYLPFNERYEEVFISNVKIPDRKFNSLKSRHHKKVELSKMIDKFPKSSLFILKFRMFLTSFTTKDKA